MSDRTGIGQVLGFLGLALLYLFAAVISLTAVYFLYNGFILASNGGSIYYPIAGALLLASGAFLFMRKRLGAWVFALMLAITIVWSIWEVGFDGWGLMPRLTMFAGFGLWLLMPWVQTYLRGNFAPVAKLPLGATGAIVGGSVVSIALGGVAFAAFNTINDDPRFQTGFGEFPAQASVTHRSDAGEDWPFFGGDLGGTRYSPLKQITPENVSKLQVAWEVDVGRVPYIGASPIKVDDTVYTCNIVNGVFALDAKTGAERWSHDAANGYGGTCRGVSYHKQAGETGACSERIILGNATGQLRALDARTGEFCAGFGNDGIVDLLKGMGDHAGEVIGGYYRVTSAPTIVRDRIVVGGWVTDNQYWGSPSGVIRAFDVITGEFEWAWDLGNPGVHTEPPEGQHYTHSTPNSWAPMSADEERGLVFLPTGNATPDFFGAQRRDFDDQFSTSIVALDANTGSLVWSFQTLHHDIWDYDVPAQPTLLNLRTTDGETVPAVIQPTKQGEIYILNRETGEPLFDVTEHPVPQEHGAPEERLSPTQPFSDQLPSFRGPVLREADMWGITPFDQLHCRVMYSKARYEGPFTPAGLTPSIQHPAAFGAINWGGVSVHPELGVMVVNSNRLANYVQLITREDADARGMDRQGEFGNPSELALGGPMQETPYAVIRPYWLTALNVPCNAPPYGLISAVDLNTGKLLWSDSLGTSLGSGAFGIGMPLALPMGTPNHAGSLTTSTGLTFIGATKDNLFQAFDLKTGKILWQVELPGGGGSAPITYTVDGKQYLVIHAGGSGAIQSRRSTKMVAFALPN